jgi:two-component system, cell cycle sensor histidine kinase and response regulator CckA
MVFDMKNAEKSVEEQQLTDELTLLRKQVAELKAREVRYKQSEDRLFRLDKAFETMQIGITITDMEGKILYTNPADAKLHGYTVEELIGKNVRIFSPSWLCRPMNLEQIRGISRWNRKSFNIRKDGSIFPVNLTSDAVKNVSGYPVGIVTSCEDITERERTDELLDKSEARFRGIFDEAAIGIVIVNLNGQVIESNRAMQEMIGYSAEELRKMVFSEFTYKEDTVTSRRLFREVVERKRSHYQIEKPYYHKDGSLVWGQVTVSIVRNSRGKPEFTIGMIENITERKRAEDALKQSEERLVAFFEASRDGILVEENEIIIYANKSYANLCGYENPENLIGKNISNTISPHDKERMLEFGRKRLRGEQIPSLYEFRAEGRDGTPIDLEASVSTSTIAGRNYIITVARDITERKRLEEQFRQSQKMEAVGMLAGGVAHDFNNLLTVIIGLSDILLRKLEYSPKLHHHAHEIRKAGERAASLTHQLLAFSRRQILQPQVLNINTVVSEMNSMLRRLISEDIELITLLEPNLWCVKADRNQVEQVILNLVINARDAMPTGGRLWIETANFSIKTSMARQNFIIEPGKYVLLKVSDNGCGMDTETLNRIFEPFFTTKEQGKGTGLGLSTVYGIVKQSGGYIEAGSALHYGTTFEVYLPQIYESVESSTSTVLRSEYEAVSETILLVEDEISVREMTSFLLKEKGYNVLEARDGWEALQICEQSEDVIHLMVTDVVMPHMSGPELTKQIKKMRPSLSILYMTGYADKALGILEEGSSILEKPFTADTLWHKVRESLDKSFV